MTNGPRYAVSSKSKLFKADAGTVIGPDERFNILGLHHSAATTPLPTAQSTYIAQDTKTNEFVTLTILNDEETVSYQETSQDRIENTLRKDSRAVDHVILAADSLILETPSANRCLVHELTGPNLYMVLELNDTFLPADWIWKAFKDALSSLAILHARKMVHGDIRAWSLVITYSKVDAANADQVRNTYGPLSESNGAFEFNATGTGNEQMRPNLDFQLKLHRLDQAFIVGDNIPDTAQYQLPGPSPPEIQSTGPTPATDIWYLASIFLNLATGTPSESHFLDANGSALSSSISSTQEALYAAAYKQRTYMRPESELIEESGSGDFSVDELRVLSDLLAHLLVTDPEQRFTAEQALQHEFFAVQRPVSAAAEE
ncbi:kinase-like domain-containing protein [Elsinoe ampelina]|uniref:Kinase-like domain-containing protein n=1 Tax=Elsinoe ampelina TaxID=302913 RepID=A0A6A6GAL4_9PEZI|nr:kinase-like domain-containing protein [Elsinoe ampelina]